MNWFIGLLVICLLVYWLRLRSAHLKIGICYRDLRETQKILNRVSMRLDRSVEHYFGLTAARARRDGTEEAIEDMQAVPYDLRCDFVKGLPSWMDNRGKSYGPHPPIGR